MRRDSRVLLGLATALLLPLSTAGPAMASNGDRVGDRLVSEARRLYKRSLICTRQVLGKYRISGDGPGVAAGGEISRDQGPFVAGKGGFSAKDALACRDAESAALVFFQSARRVKSRAELRRLLPKLEKRIDGMPNGESKARCRESLGRVKRRL